MIPKPSEFVERVHEEIDKGWHQGSYGLWTEPEGNVCLVGAMRRVQFGTNKWDTLVDAINGALEKKTWDVCHLPAYHAGSTYALDADGRCNYRVHWNDKPGRTKEEVLDVVMAVAKEFRDAGQ